ncbi:MAG: N-acetylmuramoyl-L-alanine amidase [Chthoniobacterales bacterium]|nr:N-acetylmuramoyl-L-alanine amidase [Chthoniobacterales bacterium]
MKGGTLPLLGLATLLLSAWSARAAEWHVHKHQGRDYVTFRNVAEFYRFSDYQQANRTVSLRSDRRGVRAQADKSELYINGVRFFTHFPIVTQNNESMISAIDVGKIVEPILRPSRIDNAQKVETVILDPGHGGTDTGGSNRWGSEKEFTLHVAATAREQLLRAGFKVEMTRTADSGISLEERIEFANRIPNAVFVSIHFNSGTGGNGVESYALTPEGLPSSTGGSHHAAAAANGPETHEGNQQDAQNISLTAAVHASVLSRLSAHDRGVRHARFKVLRHIRIPAVLIEAGFMSDPVEGQRIATAQYRQQLGMAIAQGVQNYNAAVNYRTQDAGFTIVRTNLPPHSRPITEPLDVNQPLPPLAPHEPSISITPGG